MSKNVIAIIIIIIDILVVRFRLSSFSSEDSLFSFTDGGCFLLLHLICCFQAYIIHFLLVCNMHFFLLSIIIWFGNRFITELSSEIYGNQFFVIQSFFTRNGGFVLLTLSKGKSFIMFNVYIVTD